MRDAGWGGIARPKSRILPLWSQEWWVGVVSIHAPKDQLYRLAAEAIGFPDPNTVSIK